jgi:ribonuclease HI
MSAADVAPTNMMVGNDRDSHGCIGSAGYIWSDTAQKCVRPWEESGSTMQYATGLVMPTGPKMMSGAEAELRAVHMALSQLSEADRAELMKTIKTYVESKGVKIPTPEQMQAVQQDNKTDRKEVKEGIKQDKKAIQEAAKQKREDMRKRIQERKTNLTK